MFIPCWKWLSLSPVPATEEENWSMKQVRCIQCGQVKTTWLARFQQGKKIGYRHGLFAAWKAIDKAMLYYPPIMDFPQADFARKLVNHLAQTVRKLAKP